ncbi:MAG: hypothetical protein ABR923_19550 [Terracidiphilus sp.]
MSSARLRDFLAHVTASALQGTPEDATEKQIGIQVFQRRPGFNTSEDSIVRSQARLLRKKLSSYYASEGASEEIRIEIPKGRYTPEFSHRTASRDSSLANGNALVLIPGETERDEGPLHGPRLLTRGTIVNGSTASVPYRINSSFRTNQMDRVSPLDIFWGSIFKGPRPMVIYSNEPFAESPEEGLRYARTKPQNAPGGQVFDHLTGVGEVQAVFHITRLFERSGVEFMLKRSALVPWDDARQTNLIFIGSVTENSALRVLPPTEHFHLSPGAESIRNNDPLPDEPKTYHRSNYPITRDYAILSLGAGLTPSCKALVFAGLTTLGTQAAVEYACNPETVSDLLRKVGLNDSVRPFEAVLEVSVTGGVPILTQVVAIRVA